MNTNAVSSMKLDGYKYMDNTPSPPWKGKFVLERIEDKEDLDQASRIEKSYRLALQHRDNDRKLAAELITEHLPFLESVTFKNVALRKANCPYKLMIRRLKNNDLELAILASGHNDEQLALQEHLDKLKLKTSREIITTHISGRTQVIRFLQHLVVHKQADPFVLNLVESSSFSTFKKLAEEIRKDEEKPMETSVSLKLPREITCFQLDSLKDGDYFVENYGKNWPNVPNTYIEHIRFHNTTSAFYLKRIKENQFLLEIATFDIYPSIQKYLRDMFEVAVEKDQTRVIVNDPYKIKLFLQTLAKKELLPFYAVDLLDVPSFRQYLKTVSDSKLQAYLKQKEENEAAVKKVRAAREAYMTKLANGEIEFPSLFAADYERRGT